MTIANPCRAGLTCRVKPSGKKQNKKKTVTGFPGGPIFKPITLVQIVPRTLTLLLLLTAEIDKTKRNKLEENLRSNILFNSKPISTASVSLYHRVCEIKLSGHNHRFNKTLGPTQDFLFFFFLTEKHLFVLDALWIFMSLRTAAELYEVTREEQTGCFHGPELKQKCGEAERKWRVVQNKNDPKEVRTRKWCAARER